MILNGLGGQVYSDQHAERLGAAGQLRKSTPADAGGRPAARREARLRATYPECGLRLTSTATASGNGALLAALELRRTVFRSDHASNWLSLRGTLGIDKARLLGEVQAALADPQNAPVAPAAGAWFVAISWR